MELFHPAYHALTTPEKIAVKFVPSGQALTFQELDLRSNQAAHLLRDLGLDRGAVIALFMHNCPQYFEVAWAADRTGLYYTGISSQLTADEVAYILQDSGATVLFTCQALLAVARDAARQVAGLRVLIVDGPAVEEVASYRAERDRQPATPVNDQSRGMPMLYSSGTTGRPKGVRFPLPDLELGGMDPLTALLNRSFGLGRDAVYLSPAPLYHAAPLRFSMSVQRIGGTVIAMEKFDPELALQAIESERVTHSQWVPTHFVRMLKMRPEQRVGYDLSSHRFAVHAAAPCPVPVKREMLDWWGPIIHEYYSGTEFNGMTFVDPMEWLSHPGTVGRPIFGTAHITADDGVTELSAREEGLVYFEGGTQFSYHNDPKKTDETYNAKGWSTLGDIGWLDEDGYLYLTDRKSFMIISGGVNIYPQEIEDAIIVHPKVADAAVIGAPDEDFGERVVAVVQPLDWHDAGSALAEEIRSSLARSLSKIKMPRQIEFMRELPRHPTGKLYKRLLRDQFALSHRPPD